MKTHYTDLSLVADAFLHVNMLGAAAQDTNVNPTGQISLKHSY